MHRAALLGVYIVMRCHCVIMINQAYLTNIVYGYIVIRYLVFYVYKIIKFENMY